MDEQSREQIRVIVEQVVQPLVVKVEEIETALWGDEDSRRRETQPGLVAIVAELQTDLQKRRTILAFLSTVVGIVGLTNVIALFFVVTQVVATP